MSGEMKLNSGDCSPSVSASPIDINMLTRMLHALCEVSETQCSPAFVLQQLLLCCDTQTLIDIAENPQTREEILIFLARIRNDDVRFAMAENHNFSFNLLSILASDENPHVSCRASRTIERKKCSRIVEAVFVTNLSNEKSKQIC